MSENNLYKRSGAELAHAFKAIPIGVTLLNLSWNRLGKKSDTEQAQAFEAIPNSVTALDLRENSFNHKSASELTEIFKAIPANVTTFHLSNNTFSQEQVKVLLTVLGPRKEVHLNFGEKTFGKELDEEIRTINMRRSLLGYLLNHTIFSQPSDSTQAATSSAHADTFVDCSL